MSVNPGQIRVLHVDDEPDFAEIAATFLHQESGVFDVDTALDADEATSKLGENSYDCVVSDYDMPGTHGIEFLRQVRRTHGDIPFILFTGKGSEEIAGEAISAGVTDYLQKGTGTSQYGILANRIQNAVDRRRARRQADRTEEQLHLLAENTDDILWMYTADWEELLFINSAYEDIWGRDIEELRAYPPAFQRGVHPDDRSITGEAMADLSAGEPIDIEFRVNADEDFGRWVWVKGYPVFEQDGTVSRVTGFARDITDRKEREQLLQREREQLNALFKNTSDPVAFTEIVDAEPIIREINRSFEETFGWATSEAVGRPLDEIVVPADQARRAEARALSERIAAGDRIEEEVRRQSTGGTRDFLVQSVPLQLGETARYSFTIYSDITALKDRQSELQRERDRHQEFTRVLSHDLRNPLSVAEARLELAAEECESDDLDAVASAHERMRSIIDEVLTLARAGEEVGDLETLDLGALVESCRASVPTNSATLVNATDHAITADRQQLRHVIENLIRNAVDHGPAGVTVRVEDLPEGFAVADDGPGIPAEERDAVFTAGYTTAEEGNGFGLSIVRNIVDAHGWSITVTESRDGGTRIECTGVDIGETNSHQRSPH